LCLWRSPSCFDFEVFKGYVTELLGDLEAAPMLPVIANARLASRQSSKAPQLFQASFRAFRASCQNTLRVPFLFPDALKTIRQRQAIKRTLTDVKRCRQSERIRHTSINTEWRTPICRYHVFNRAGKGDMPAIAIKRYGHVLNDAAQRTRITKAHIADF
jgi:hypothetical protein